MGQQINQINVMFTHFFLPIRFDYVFQILLWNCDAGFHDLNHMQTKHYLRGIRRPKRSKADASSVCIDDDHHVGKFSAILDFHPHREWKLASDPDHRLFDGS
jgi:hypothetical protein